MNYKVPKVLVTGQDDSVLVGGVREYLVVFNSRIHFENGKYVMAFVSEMLHDGEVDTFVGEQPHLDPCRLDEVGLSELR